MAATPQYIPGANLVNYGGAAARPIQNKPAATTRGGTNSAGSSPRPGSALAPKAAARPVTPMGTAAAPAPPKPTTAPRPGYVWQQVSGRWMQVLTTQAPMETKGAGSRVDGPSTGGRTPTTTTSSHRGPWCLCPELHRTANLRRVGP